MNGNTVTVSRSERNQESLLFLVSSRVMSSPVAATAGFVDKLVLLLDGPFAHDDYASIRGAQ